MKELKGEEVNNHKRIRRMKERQRDREREEKMPQCVWRSLQYEGGPNKTKTKKYKGDG